MNVLFKQMWDDSKERSYFKLQYFEARVKKIFPGIG